MMLVTITIGTQFRLFYGTDGTVLNTVLSIINNEE